ncbi:LysE family translocator [Halomonas sp. KO116]|uniref:LysE family translocator n=1 Tax=Halomonas sp. KO116 TaxID=1504981 RepID=UPI0004E3D023|nr:LysE family translocator [Halomonas sp. KO116]AJY50069.1 Lysine exporter protein (LYSE/YGGA) [Halomonas sp. KO116]
MEIEKLLLYFVADFTAYIIPGPATLLVLVVVLTSGRCLGLFTTAGILTAETVYFGLSAAGLGLLIVNNAMVFMAIKYLGALYLIWLGIKDIKNSIKLSNIKTHNHNNEIQKIKPSDAYIKGFIINISNPKALLVYIAILPQFINKENGLVFQIIVLYILGMLAGLMAFMVYIVVAEKIRSKGISDEISKKIGFISGFLLIIIGLFFGLLS